MHVGRWAQAEVEHGGQWMQASRGVAGRANVRLGLASSVLSFIPFIFSASVCFCGID